MHFLDENGKVHNNLFLPGDELWDPSYQRLTMTFDPGRIKRGLTSNETIWPPPIAEGVKRYDAGDRSRLARQRAACP